MIELVFTGICKGCAEADIMVDKMIMYSDGKHREAVYVAKCDHEDACRRLTKEEDGK